MVSATGESTVKYHPYYIWNLTPNRESGRETLLGGQFDWGGLLLNCNGGVLRLAWCDWKPHCKGMATSQLNCESDMTSRCESRTK